MSEGRNNPVTRESARRKQERRTYEQERLKGIAQMRRQSLWTAYPLEFIRDFFSGKLPTADTIAAELKQRDEEYFTEMLEMAKQAVSIMMHDDETSYRAGEIEHELPMVELGAWLERSLIEGRLPDTIISEDVTGRTLAQIMRSFLTRLRTHSTPTTVENIPVLSYAVGRFTPPEEAHRLAYEVGEKLRKRGAQNVLVCTDAVETGTSMEPLLKEIGGRFDLSLMIDRITQRAESMIVKRTEKKPATRISLHPGLEIGQGALMRPLERWYPHKGDKKTLLLAIEEIESRPYRLKAVEELSDLMFEEFLKRPGVQEYLATKE
ncbi:hypothetical protein K2Y00_02365 [Patescibacteria group bacterium]|nr:hypothetical protein [Patescibacteria group bacterium]